jgi:hypothetical protein
MKQIGAIAKIFGGFACIAGIAAVQAAGVHCNGQSDHSASIPHGDATPNREGSPGRRDLCLRSQRSWIVQRRII